MKYRSDDKNYASIAKMLPADAMAAWCEAANDAADMALEHNACVMAGWDAVKKGWERPEGGKKWVRKDNPGSGDVHVDGVMGAGGKKKKPKPYTVGGDANKFQSAAQVCKVDSNLGIVFGFAIVCTKDGEDYFDLQSDNIPEDAM